MIIKKFALFNALLLTSPSLALGQDLLESVTLPETVVIANRIEQDVDEVSPNLTIISEKELAEKQLASLEEALATIPGVLVSPESSRGSITQTRFRGTDSDHRALVFDGVRINDSNIDPGNFVGNVGLGGVGRLSILRGPQSTLYGGGAIGGVLDLETGRGTETPQQALSVEAGSFGSLRAQSQFSGTLGELSYYLSLGHEATDNGLDNNDFRQWESALRLETKVSDGTVAGMTFRSWNSEYENPLFATPFDLGERDAFLVTAYLESEISTLWSWQLRAGYYSEEYSVGGNFPFLNDYEKSSLEWTNNLTWNDQHETVAGLLVERADYVSTFGVNDVRWSGAAFVNHLWKPTEELSLTAGVRGEFSEVWDNVLTWRSSLRYQLPATGLSFHASAGTGFRPPSFGELFGLPTFGLPGNPDLEEEYSFGWDAGLRWALNDETSLDLTYFENYIDNRIDTRGFGSPPENIGQAVTRGVEASAKGGWLDERLTWSLAGSLLFDAKNADTSQRLIRRPRWSGSFDVQATATEKLKLGLGASYGGQRQDTDFSAGQDITLDSRFLLRAYASYDLTENISLTGRIENALDVDYQEVVGFPTRGFGAFGGVRMEF